MPEGSRRYCASRGTPVHQAWAGEWAQALPLVKGSPVSSEGQALAQFIPLPGHEPQLDGEVLHLLIHLPVSEERWWGGRLPGGAWREENKANSHSDSTQQVLF